MSWQGSARERNCLQRPPGIARADPLVMVHRAHPSWLWIAALTTYLGSLVVPAVVVLDTPLLGGHPYDRTVSGMECVVFGWLATPAWLANPLFLVAVTLEACRFHRVALGLACGALVVGAGGVAVFAATDARFIHLHVGFAIWIGSMLALLASACASLRRARGC
jgi:hypothetical protein